MKTEFIGMAKVNSGYFDDMDMAAIVFDPNNGTTYQVYPFGWCALHPVKCIDAIEAQWIATNHPTCRGRVKFI